MRTQNLHGCKSDSRLAELFDSFRRRRVFAACVQETWRDDKEDLVDGGNLLVSVDLPSAQQQQSRRSRFTVHRDVARAGGGS